MKEAKRKLILVMLIFGSIGLFVREVDLSSGQIALARGMIGCIFLAGAGLIRKQKFFSPGAVKPNLLLLTASGAAIGFNWIFLFEAYKYTTISNATLCYYFAPVFVMLLSPFILKEPLTLVKAVCIAGAAAGMFLIAGSSGGYGKNHFLGISFGLAAAILYAAVMILNRFLKGLTGLETTVIQLGAASAVLLPYVILTQRIRVFQLSGKTIIILLVVGIVHTGVAYLLYFTAINKLDGQTTAVLSYIDPLSAIILSAVFLGEIMTGLQIIGGILILGAAMLNEVYGKRKAKSNNRHIPKRQK